MSQFLRVTAPCIMYERRGHREQVVFSNIWHVQQRRRFCTYTRIPCMYITRFVFYTPGCSKHIQREFVQRLCSKNRNHSTNTPAVRTTKKFTTIMLPARRCAIIFYYTRVIYKILSSWHQKKKKKKTGQIGGEKKIGKIKKIKKS